MISPNSSSSTTAHWGKLTSLNPNFNNIFLSTNPSHFTIPNNCAEENFPLEYKCQIYQDKQDFFLCYIGDSLLVLIEDQTLKQNEASKIHSGERLTFILKKQDEISITMDYIFSGELNQTQKDIFKESHEILKAKFSQDLKNETQCVFCCKMIYECVSVVPCLHSFCMYCLTQHLKDSQACPQCSQQFTELRKNVFLNNIIEASDESGLFRKDRSQEECKQITHLLETEILFTTFEYTNGDIYQGEWKKCRKEGNGKMRYKNGSVYEGDWKNNKMHGKGRGVYGGGDIYEGDWKNHVMEGQGKMIYKNGDIYEGNWRNNKMEGYGKKIHQNGDIYQGDWKNSKRDGKGKKFYADGNIYEGDWRRDKRHGFGKKIYSDGQIYEGEWRNNRKEGKGKGVSKAGDIYDGDWRKNKREGHGIMVFYDGTIYEGSWKNNIREGKGKEILKNGDIYEGDWENDMRSGKGKIRYVNGDVYEGEWKKDLKEGQGKMMYKNGDFYEGEWKNGEKYGKGKMVYANGDIFEGTWKNNMDGKGKMVFKRGGVYEGFWRSHRLYERQEKFISQIGNGSESEHKKKEISEEGHWDFKKHGSLGKILSESGKIRKNNHNIHDKENIFSENESKEKIVSQGVNIYKKDWQNNEINSIGKIRKNKAHVDEKGKKLEIDVGIFHGDWIKDLIDRNRQMILRHGSIYEGYCKDGSLGWEN